MAANDVFTDALSRLEQIGKDAGIDAEAIAALQQPLAVLTASVPLRMDDGSMRYLTAYRCRYTETLYGTFH